MKFNHETNSLPDALGVEQHKYASQLATNRLLNMMEDFQNKDTFNLSEN